MAIHNAIVGDYSGVCSRIGIYPNDIQQMKRIITIAKDTDLSSNRI